MRIALIGATGLVGSRLVPLLRHHDVLLLSRRAPGFAGVREKVATADAWPAMLAGERLDAAVSALGSTWRKAGSWEVFEQVDRHRVVDFAEAALAAGARQMLSVSSVGADPRSLAEYLALKGRVDNDLAGLAFERLDLLRPGLLRGPRGGDRRLKERLGIALSPFTNLFLRGRNDRFAAIDAVEVAKAIAALLGAGESGTFVHENREIRCLASS
ncbi:MAG: hypothetical protein H0T82_10100 [Sphingomonas sp.]|nr:hypothetical protein [Sphingomonas sp.]